ncbi:MAG: hypothetical protein QXS51_05740 [Thermoproteota archaeon]|nr:hypothetical protein [Candidatus Brockarchaeota archaeon]
MNGVDRVEYPKLSEAIIASGIKPGIKPSDLYEICSDAFRNNIRNVCLPTVYLDELIPVLRETGLKASTIVSFPTGLLPLEIKIMEMRFASHQNVEEVYFYPNLGNYLDNRIVEFELELSRFLEESQLIGLKQIKPIVEVDLLSNKQINELIGIFKMSGFDAVMLSFSSGLRNIRDEEMSFLKEIPKHIALEVNCRVRSVEEIIGLIEKKIGRICTVDYRIILESLAGE